MKSPKILGGLGIGAALLCPLCLPAFAAVLTSLGIAALIPAWPWILGVILLATVIIFAINFKKHKNISPLVLAIIGSILILVGKYVAPSNVIWIAGALILIASLVLDHRAGASCKSCKI